MTRLLAIDPEADGYSASPGEGAIRAVLDGGAAQYRADYEGAPTRLTLTWLLDGPEYRYMRAFYRTATLLGSEPFYVNLIMDGATPTQHLAKFVPGTVELVGVQGKSFTFRAGVEARPRAEVITDAVLEALAYLVNVKMPAHIGYS